MTSCLTTRQYVFIALELPAFLIRFNISTHVRRRSLLALRALSKEQPDLIKPVITKTRKRLQDSEPAVANAALVVVFDLVNVSLGVYLSNRDLHFASSPLFLLRY